MDIKKNLSANAMIVEDEKDLCFLLQLILKKQNLNTLCVNTLMEAKYVIKKIKPHILFLDNNLPDGKGVDFIIDIKKLCPSTTVIMITAHDSPLEVERAFNEGADYFISKPFNTATIVNMLNNISLPLCG